MTELATTQQQIQFRILLIGDICIDEYKYGNVTRISPEAPVPVFVPDSHIIKDGMAGNVRNNLEALGCKVTLKYSIDLEGKISKKTRYIDKKSKQHIIRIDEDRPTQALETSAFDNLDYDAIVVSDYNKGAVSYDLIEWLRKQYSGPIFIDTKKTDLARFEGCYIKINKLERRQAHTLPSSEYLIVTYGDSGAVYNEEHYSGIKAGDVTDVCGAGDTFLAALTYKFVETNNIRTAIKFANKAAAITVQHLGVYAPCLGEIE
jgi:D-beta-D-heptose 7-phosphate kinase/D-beta-D-heptose 1-phosphate adenosyltransferase